MLDRLSRIQLTIFAVVTVLTVGAISIFYLQLPATVGIGTYKVDANFVAGGGIYQNANVTYRGVTIGRVESVGLTDDGVIANMRLNSNTPVPDNVTATVKSVSAVGEQYIDLVPPTRRIAREAAQRVVDRTGPHRHRPGHRGPAETGRHAGQQRRQHPAAGSAARNVQGVQRIRARAGPDDPVVPAAGRRGQRQLRADHAADRPGRPVPGRPDPQRRQHQVAGRRPGPVHHRTAPGRSAGARPATDRTWSRRRGEHRVHRYPAELSDAGGQPGQPGPGRRDLPQVDRAGAGDLPGAVRGADHRRRRRAHRRGRQARLQGRPRRSAALHRRLPARRPRSARPPTRRCAICRPTCTARPRRTTRLWSAARATIPCQEFPGKRAPTVQLCRDPKGYVPIGRNPWRGPPIPYGTPVQDGRNILPPNKFPNIPPGADYDPGPPAVQLPPGVVPGPGPAPNAPFPLPVPPNDNAPPPPWPYYAPPDQVVPPYARPPLEAPGPPPGPVPAEAPRARRPVAG